MKKRQPHWINAPWPAMMVCVGSLFLISPRVKAQTANPTDTPSVTSTYTQAFTPTNTPTPLPTVTVNISVDPVGSTVNGNSFNLFINTQNAISLQNLTLTVTDQTTSSPLGPVVVTVGSNSISSTSTLLTSNNILNLLQNFSFAFQDGHVYGFQAQATDENGTQGTSNTATLQVDNSPPYTDFFFTNYQTKSYNTQQAWASGTPQSVDVTSVPGEVVLAGLNNLLLQPQSQTTTTASQYDFDEPTGTITLTPNVTPIQTPGLAINAVAITNPSYPTSILNVGSSIQFQPAQEESQSNLIPPNIKPYNYQYTVGQGLVGPVTIVNYSDLTYTDPEGSTGSISANLSSEGINGISGYFSNTVPYVPDPDFMWAGSSQPFTFELYSNQNTNALSQTTFGFQKIFTEPVVTDRISLSAQAVRDAYGGTGGCDTHTLVKFLVDISLGMANGKTLSSSAWSLYGQGQISQINFNVPSAYDAAGQLMQPETITSIAVSGYGYQFEPCNSGAFNGPIITLDNVGAYAPQENLNPVTIMNSDQFTSEIPQGAVTTGSPASVFNFEEDGNSFLAQTSSSSSSPVSVEVDRLFGGPVTVSNMLFENVSSSNSAATTVLLVFTPNNSGPVTVQIPSSDNLGWQPVSLQNAFPENEYKLPFVTGEDYLILSKFSIIMTGPAGTNFNFGKIGLYGDLQPYFTDAGSPATFTSPIFDMGPQVTSDFRPYRLAWTASQPAGTNLAIYARAGNWTTLQSNPQGGYNQVSSGGLLGMIGQGSPNRYFQYQVVMSHTDPAQSPVLQSMVLQAGAYASSGTWTSQPLPLSGFNLPTAPTPLPLAVVNWRSKNPTGTSMSVSILSSEDGMTWSSPTPIANGTPFPLDPNAQDVQFVAGLNTTNGIFSPELHNLDFGFFSPFPTDSTGVTTYVVSATNIFLNPLDLSPNGSNSGVAQSFGLVSQAPPTPSAMPLYMAPFPVNESSGDYLVSAYSQDYAGNVESTPVTKEIHVSTFSIEGIPESLTNAPVTLSVQLDPLLSLQNVTLSEEPVGSTGSTPTVTTLNCGPVQGSSNSTIQLCNPVLTGNGIYLITANASAQGLGNLQPINASVTIWTTAPPAPTGLNGSQCNSDQECLSWNAQSTSPVPPEDPFFNGFTVVRDGATTLATDLMTPQYTDTTAGTVNHVYQVFATDAAGNISPPATFSTYPQNLLVSDTGNDRVFELGLLPNGTPGIIWQVGTVPASTPSFPYAFLNPIAASQINTASGTGFGNTLVVDSQGAWLVDTTAFPPFVPGPTATFTPVVTIPPSPTPSEIGTPWPTSTPTPDPRLDLAFSSASLGFQVNQAQESQDGNYILAAQSFVTPGTTPVNSTGFVIKVSPGASSPLWNITGLVDPTSERELSNGDILVCDEGANTVYEVNVSNPSSPYVVWKLSGSQGVSFKAPYSAIQGKESGDYYIADTGNNRIVVLKPSASGPPADLAVIEDGFNGPRAMEERQTGNVVVADTGNNRIVEFAPSVNGNSITFNPVNIFTNVNAPSDVREIVPVNRINLTPQTNGPAFVYHPYVLSVQVTDGNGNPVTGVPVDFSTNGLEAEFVLSSQYQYPSLVDPNTGVPEGDLQFGGGVPQLTVTTDTTGTATITYFPTQTGNNPVTVSSFETQTLGVTIYANQVEAYPPPPPPLPVTSFWDSVANIALGAINVVADAALNSVGIPITLDLSTQGIGIGLGFDFVSANLNTDGNEGLGFGMDSFSADLGTQGFNAGFQLGNVSLGTGVGFNGSISANAGTQGLGVGFNSQTGFNAGLNLFNGPSLPGINTSTVSLGVGVGLNGVAYTNLEADGLSLAANSQGGGVGVNLNDSWISQQVGQDLVTGYNTYLASTPTPGFVQTGAPAGTSPNVTGNAATSSSIVAGAETNDSNTLDNGSEPTPASTIPTGGCNPVNVGNGQLLYTSRDLLIPGSGPDLNIEILRTYNNLSDFTGSFGSKWFFDYDTYLFATPLAWEIYFGDGHVEVFTRNADGTATPYAYNSSSSLTFNSTSQEWTYHNKYGMQYLFNVSGQLLSQTDRLGNSVTCAYNPNTDLLSSVEDSAGRAVSFTFTGTGGSARVTQITDPAGRMFQYSYDSNGELTGVTLPDGRQITYAYQNGLLVYRDDPHQPEGRKTMYYQYNKMDRVIQETNALGYSTHFNCTMQGINQSTVCTTTVTDARGNNMVYTFDNNQNWIKVVDPVGAVKTFTYDSNGNRLTATNALSQTTTYTYDANNNMTSMTDPLGHTTTLTYEPVYSQMTSLTNALNQTWTYSYDSMGDMVKSVDPMGYTETYTFTPQGKIASSTNADGFTNTYTHDNDGDLISAQDPLGNTVSFGYDILGRKISETDQAGNTTGFAYDAGDNLIQTTYPDKSTQSYLYDSQDDLVNETDENGHTTHFAYDAASQLISETDPCGGTIYDSYDPVGNKTSVTDKMGNLWTYSYDPDNRVISISNSAEGTQTFSYDLNGNKTSWTDGDGHTTHATYDADNHLTQMIDSDGYSTYFYRDALERIYKTEDKDGNVTQSLYDDDGHVAGIINAKGAETTFTRDPVGNITAVTDPLGHTTATAYDADNRVVSITRPEGDVKKYTYTATGLWATAQMTGCTCGTKTYTYDDRNRVATITDELGHVWSYQYDPVGNQTQTTDADGHTIVSQYDACNHLTQVSGPISGEVTQMKRDLDGHVIELTDAMSGTQNFQYDTRGKVTESTDPDGNKTSYAYTHDGKVASKTDPNGHTTTYTYDNDNNLMTVTDPIGNVTQYSYDPMGHLTQAKDADGHLSQYQLDSLAEVTQITDGNGGKITQTWDAAGRKTSITDQNGHMTQFTYDTDNRLIQKTDPLGGNQSWTYDGRDLVLSMTDPNGNTTQYAYDLAGRLMTTTNALGGAVSLVRDPVGNIVSSTDPDEHTTTMQYDAANQLISVTNPLGNTTQYQRDLLHRIVKTIDADGFTTQTVYDPDSRVTEQTDALGNATQSSYDNNGNLTQTVDPNGNATHFTYDSDNRPIKKIDALGGSTEISYDGVGNKIETTDPDGNSTHEVYDADNRLTAVTNALGGLTTYQYDGVGNVTQATDANGNATQYGYDADNRKTGMTDARGNETQFTYDSNGNLTQTTDANGHSTDSTYDVLNRLVSATNADGNKTQYQYDAVGNRTAVIDANSHSTAYTYDSDNRELSQTDPIGNQITFGYDAVGNLTTKSDSKGIRTLKYDGDRRIIEEDLPDGKKETFVYDPAGRNTQVTDWNGATQMEYDNDNRLVKRIVPDGKYMTHQYDVAGNEIGRTDYFGGNYAYAYDALNRPVQVTDPLRNVMGIVYDKTTHVIQYHEANETSCNYTYDPTYDVLQVVNKKDTGEVITQFIYQYDAVGNRTNVTDNLGKTTYTYDNANQLTQAQYPDRPAETYTYDPVGNRLSLTVGTQSTNDTYNAANMLTQAGSEALTYDGNGNLIQKSDNGQTTKYGYDTENRLTQVTLPDGTQTEFGYDYTNMRISTTEADSQGNPETKEYFWSGSDVINVDTTDSQDAYDVIQGVNLSKTITDKCCNNPRMLYYHFDGLGSIADTTDSGGNVLDNYRYDAYGQTLSGGESTANDLQFVGEYGVRTQANIGLIYMRNRWYDPELGRFITQDPIGFKGGINIFAYAFNNVINLLDIFGLDSLPPTYNFGSTNATEPIPTYSGPVGETSMAENPTNLTGPALVAGGAALVGVAITAPEVGLETVLPEAFNGLSTVGTGFSNFSLGTMNYGAAQIIVSGESLLASGATGFAGSAMISNGIASNSSLTQNLNQSSEQLTDAQNQIPSGSTFMPESSNGYDLAAEAIPMVANGIEGLQNSLTSPEMSLITNEEIQQNVDISSEYEQLGLSPGESLPSASSEALTSSPDITPTLGASCPVLTTGSP